jgi:glycosyltransferase involved in cell wall biosynthesis
VPARRVVVLQSSRAAHHPRHHYRLAAALADAGYDVVMQAQPDLSEGHEDRVPLEYLPLRRGRLARMLSAPLTIRRALRTRPDALYVVSLDLLPWAVLARRLGRAPVVVYDSNDEHHTFVLIKEWIPRPLRHPLGRLLGRVEPWLAARLDGATTALPATQQRFERAGVRSLQVRNFPPASLTGEGNRGSDYDYDVLLGGSLPGDQVDLLARTAAVTEQLHGRPLRWLVAARNYDEEDQQLLVDALEAHGVRAGFDLRYNVPFPDMQRLMERSRIGLVLYPSGLNYAERIPIRIFEYMAAGVPFVAADLPTTAEFTAGRGVAELVPAGDAEGNARAIVSLLDDPERLREMSLRGPALVRESYNWDREASRLTALFQELVGSPLS